MIKNKFLAKLSGFWFFDRWHPEVALRYLPVVSEIKKISGKPSILEVGSAGLGIAPYFRRKITGFDTKFYPPYHELLKKVTGDVREIPFADQTFDIVISVDMLEHLPENDRFKAISEMVRVARKKVIIAVPCGKKAYNQDKMLDFMYKKTTSHNYTFLREQIEYGLPVKNELKKIILKIAKQTRTKAFLRIRPNENLTLRKFLMYGWINKNLIINFIFRKVFLFFIPLFRLFNQNPCYRQIFTVDFEK